MPKTEAHPSTEIRRPRRESRSASDLKAGNGEHAEVVAANGETTHVLLPVEEYERLLEVCALANAIADIDNPDVKWVSAKQAGLQLAGLEISDARKAAGLTQKQLGEKLGLPQSQISRIERSPDHTTVRTMKKIAKALGVNVSALIR